MLLRFFDDPLLSLTKGLLRLMYRLTLGLAVFLAIVGIGVATFVLLGHPSPLAASHPELDPNYSLMLAFAPFVLATLGWFLLLLERIVGTVATGDAFVTANADRLIRMAWLMLALKLLAILQNPLLNAVFRHDVHSPFAYPNPSLLFPLTLFILARVFRQGAAMRDDLEGTI